MPSQAQAESFPDLIFENDKVVFALELPLDYVQLAIEGSHQRTYSQFYCGVIRSIRDLNDGRPPYGKIGDVEVIDKYGVFTPISEEVIFFGNDNRMSIVKVLR